MAEEEQPKTIQALTAKEIKKLAKPEFQQNPEKFYPVETFKKLGFSRSQCPKCENFYWRHSESRKTCGDSNCEGTYTFIGNGVGKGNQITFAEAWKGFEKSLTSTRIPCTSIKRYPVVARWRNDVDFVAAGIYCFQPYCVTGELDPPANPLICPQFCVRFNDLDNIGITGRHYSGFIMLGIQVFNYPDNYVFFKDECVEFNYRWLTETLGIDPDEITFIEDVWAGGGNLGPSIEYFVRGLEVGNMVFMQYKTFHDGSREELQIKIIDVGIGLERIAWLYNGTPTSYVDTFRNALGYLREKLGIEIDNEVWTKFGPYSCQLNIDEVEGDVDKLWESIGEKIGIEKQTLKDAITPVKDMYIILDHTRSVLMTITDGSLPANVGGGGNVRNILRRVFSILQKNQWWDKLSMEDFLKIFEMHKKDLEGIYGEFKEYKSFEDIIKVEYDRWKNTDEIQRKNLETILKKKKNGVLDLDDWIVAMQSWGIPADQIAQISKQPVPGNLYYEIARRQEICQKAPEAILYSTTHLPETVNLYYKDHELTEFDGKIVDVFANVLEQNKRNIIILNQSAVYPTSGGQQHDKATIKIEGIDIEFQMVNAEKVGKCVLHILDKELPGEPDDYKGRNVHVVIDNNRRAQLQAHHTGTHIVFAACRKVLGPHVWQNGAKKTIENAHLDITHYKSITKDEEKAIENEANRIINSCNKIEKYFMDKAEAEKQFGFHLYQGGIVPGNSLRVVDIVGVDTEACCGTHCDNTAEVGWIRILKTQRISDGIVRLYYVAQERAIQVLNEEHNILEKLCEQWGIDQTQIVSTASRFFNDYKKLSNQSKKQDHQILNLQIKYAMMSEGKMYFVKSDAADPTIYFSFLPQYAEQIAQKEKGIIYIGENFVFGLLGKPQLFDVSLLEKVCKESSTKEIKMRTQDQVKFDFKEKGKKPVVTKGVLQLTITGANFNVEKLGKFLLEHEVQLIE